MSSFLAHFAVDGRLIAATVALFGAIMLGIARSRMHRNARAIFSVFDVSASCVSGRHGRCHSDARCPCKCHPHSQVHSTYADMSLSNR